MFLIPSSALARMIGARTSIIDTRLRIHIGHPPEAAKNFAHGVRDFMVFHHGRLRRAWRERGSPSGAPSRRPRAALEADWEVHMALWNWHWEVGPGEPIDVWVLTPVDSRKLHATKMARTYIKTMLGSYPPVPSHNKWTQYCPCTDWMFANDACC